ncbi:hypothetical protein F5Y18DRAFT_427061 [Xylariaceae sp. FL1019]|nr:hypothetical protein F5Y18DRAFT_427061 [Xylariaceae sp. FL1019]
MWYQTKSLPPAFDPCKDAKEEFKYNQALSDPNRVYGVGTEEDPLVVWMSHPDDLDRELVWTHNNFAKAIAKSLGLTHTWIIKGAHNQEYARDAYGRKIWDSVKKKWLTKEADMHITLRLGTGLYDCNLSAHAYVLLDDRNCPQKYMDTLTRAFMKGKGDSQIEFWPWKNYRSREVPRRDINLGHDWELHANVGPYLDTYRPDERVSGDTYTPRKHNEHPLENEDRRVVGRMTNELAALQDKCDTAYEVYKALHFELTAMERPCQNKMRELHAMREQIITMKREAYREAAAVIEP